MIRKDEFKNLLLVIMDMKANAYDVFKVDTAADYLREVLEFDQWGREQMLKSNHFWSWWENQWALRNEKLVFELGLNDLDWTWYADYRTVVKESFYCAHSLYALNVYPNRVVMEASYGEMVGKMIDAKTKKEAA